MLFTNVLVAVYISLSMRWLAVFRMVVSYAYVSNMPTRVEGGREGERDER